MEFEFSNRKMERLYTDERGARKYPPRVVGAFFEVIRVIEKTVDYHKG